MDIFLHIVHALSALVLIVFILLQQGKGATAGASFGAGASGTMFGSAGAGNFMTRTTAILAAVFMITSLALAWEAKRATSNNGVDVPALQQVIQEQHQQSSAPAVAPAQPAGNNDVPTVGGNDVPAIAAPAGDSGKK